MSPSWKMIPRYHPQISAWDVCSVFFSSKKNTPLPFNDLNDKSKESIFWLNGATAALTVALKALNLSPESGVAVPPYSCITVFEAVKAAGLKCVFIDLEPETFRFDLNALKLNEDKIAAVILIHTFGCHGDINEVKNILPGIPVIEDSSHAIESYLSDRPLGLQGEMSVFSFNLNKPISAGGNGSGTEFVPEQHRI